MPLTEGSMIENVPTKFNRTKKGRTSHEDKGRSIVYTSASLCHSHTRCCVYRCVTVPIPSPSPFSAADGEETNRATNNPNKRQQLWEQEKTSYNNKKERNTYIHAHISLVLRLVLGVRFFACAIPSSHPGVLVEPFLPAFARRILPFLNLSLEFSPSPFIYEWLQ